MGFSRKEYWNGLAFLSPGDLPDPGIKPASPALAGEFFSLPLSHQGSSNLHNLNSVLGHISSFQPQNNPVRTPVHSQWDCKNWCSHYGNQYGDSLRKLKIELPYHSTIPVLGILKKKKNSNNNSNRYICISMFTAALFTIAKIWKQPKCLSQING